VLRLAERPLEVEAGVVDVIERADFALLAYVARLLAGNKVSPLALFRATAACSSSTAPSASTRPTCGGRLAWRSIRWSRCRAALARAVRAPFEAALLRHMREPSPRTRPTCRACAPAWRRRCRRAAAARCGSSPLPSSRARR
jgi:chemosensory pili system protein ChpA (sensor histidine kinase/response regulator)